MSTSGSTTWSLQRDSIINAALRKLAVLSGGSTPATYEITNATEALNALLKGFYADGMPLWAMSSYTFTPIVGVAAYNIGIGQTLNTPMPMKVVQAWRGSSNSSNIPMNVYSNTNYNILPLTYSSGIPVNLYYQPLSTYGTINLWPLPADNSNTISIRYQRPFEDMNASTDNLDFPAYWTEAVIYGLADRLAPEYGIPLEDRKLLSMQATTFHANALSFGSEDSSFYIQPNNFGRF
jgi:hypothetical protein